ncbi:MULTISPECIES: hypothetical protein [unclassified Actinoplanes]|uniref:hypothetical protein n=1 Tax=unclassified Actinoplanes TaxID=2626549 RepID=UPI0003002F84|nr:MULTISPECIES: hypothetical protein [unclassified Actinoplanes]
MDEHRGQAVLAHRWAPITGELPVTVSIGVTAAVPSGTVQGAACRSRAVPAGDRVHAKLSQPSGHQAAFRGGETAAAKTFTLPGSLPITYAHMRNRMGDA